MFEVIWLTSLAVIVVALPVAIYRDRKRKTLPDSWKHWDEQKSPSCLAVNDPADDWGVNDDLFH